MTPPKRPEPLTPAERALLAEAERLAAKHKVALRLMA